MTASPTFMNDDSPKCDRGNAEEEENAFGEGSRMSEQIEKTHGRQYMQAVGLSTTTQSRSLKAGTAYLRVRAFHNVRPIRRSIRFCFTLAATAKGKITTTKATMAQRGIESGPHHKTITVMAAPTMTIRLTIQSLQLAAK
jgi:hypothetical protein